MNALNFNAKNLQGQDIDLKQYLGQVVLVVNTASKCGFTPQYQGLEQVYQQFKDKGVIVLGFPCNQFGHQEPGTADEIGSFCEKITVLLFPYLRKLMSTAMLPIRFLRT